MCCKSNSTFLIFAVLVVWRRPCHRLTTAGFLKGGTAYPVGVREGLAAGGTARTLKKMLIFPAWSPKLVLQKALFMDISAGKFCCRCQTQFPNLAKKAFEVIVPFDTTYRREQSFSVMILQWKTSSAIAWRQCLRLALSKTEPRIKELAASKQAHVSHWI